MFSCGRAGQHYDSGANPYAPVQLLDILVEQTDAAGRHCLSNARGLVCAVNTIKRVAKI
jgi:hypothetical protein